MQRPFALWLIVQGLLIGFKWTIQYITAANGFLIVLLVLLPGLEDSMPSSRVRKSIAYAG